MDLLLKAVTNIFIGYTLVGVGLILLMYGLVMLWQYLDN